MIGTNKDIDDISELDPLLERNNHDTKVLTITSSIEEQVKQSDLELFSSLWEDKGTILDKGKLCMIKLSKKQEELESRESLLLMQEQKLIENRSKVIELHKKLLEKEVELLDKELELKKREIILVEKEHNHL
jgi:hypothetical protein